MNETLKYCIPNILNKPHRVVVHFFLFCSIYLFTVRCVLSKDPEQNHFHHHHRQLKVGGGVVAHTHIITVCRLFCFSKGYHRSCVLCRRRKHTQ